MKEKLIEFYLDYVNNFLTIERLAEHYGLREKDCELLIPMGKFYHEQKVRYVLGIESKVNYAEIKLTFRVTPFYITLSHGSKRVKNPEAILTVDSHGGFRPTHLLGFHPAPLRHGDTFMIPGNLVEFE